MKESLVVFNNSGNNNATWYTTTMIVGVDEVGRGCWAGPVVAGAVLLGAPLPGLRDSKKLSRGQRQQLDVVIRGAASAFGLGWASQTEVDQLGLTAAVGIAMQRAVAQISLPYEAIIIDGNYNFLKDNPKSSCLVKADDTIPAVSAASIIAKVARDAYMAEMAERYPGYAFERHVGYGTALHRQALATLGVSELHRLSFAPIRALLHQAA
jgi:ribonuclease HII